MNLEQIKFPLAAKDVSLGLDREVNFVGLEIVYKKGAIITGFEEDGVTPLSPVQEPANIVINYKYNITRLGSEGLEEVLDIITVPFDNNLLNPKKINGVIQYEEDGITPIMEGEIDKWRRLLGNDFILPSCWNTLETIKNGINL